MSRLSREIWRDIKVIAAFCITATLWVLASEGVQWIGEVLIRHGHNFWGACFVIVSLLMILALLFLCLQMSWRLWKGRDLITGRRTNVQDP